MVSERVVRLWIGLLKIHGSKMNREVCDRLMDQYFGFSRVSLYVNHCTQKIFWECSECDRI